MADRSRSLDLEDPLQVYSGLSLFPRTLKSQANSLPPPPYPSDDLQHTHSLLESMPLQMQSELLEQAKVILDSSSELLNAGIPVNVVSEGENERVEMNPIANQRERRPGLGRKRARFSLKPATSQPTPSFEPSFDVSKYQNPEDFFLEYEKFENAKREWQKQTGTSLADTNQNQPSIRPRRPGISGRKRATYNHRYSTDAINLEASNEEILSPSEHRLLKENTIARVTTMDRELADSIIETEKKVDDILGELLACTQDELEGDGAVNLLEERLQIKPIDVEKLSLPELQDVRKLDLKGSRRNPLKPRTVLSDIQNMLKGIHSETGSKNSQTASPLQSPSASVSSLKKHMSLANPQKDQFSFLDSNHLLPDISTRSVSQQSNEVDAAKDLNICTRYSTSDNDADVVSDVSPTNVGIGDVAGPLHRSEQKTSIGVDSGTHSSMGRSHSTAEGNDVGNSMDDSMAKRNPIRPELNVDMQPDGNDGGVLSSASDSNRNFGRSEVDPDIHAVEANQSDALAADTPQGATRMDDSTVEKDGVPTQLDESSKSPKGAQEKDKVVNGYSESAGDLQEQRSEQNQHANSRDGLPEQIAEEVHDSSRERINRRNQKTSHENKRNKRSKIVSIEGKGNKRTKTVSCVSEGTKQTERISHESNENKQRKVSSRESKAFSRRKSLAAAGTKWESGIRRSTRIKSRPLEYWKGERFLYGRIHESLATVIGIKYESPAKSEKGKPKLKVKSFVSDEYRELVEQAALH